MKKKESSSSLSSIIDRLKHCNLQGPCFPSSRIRKSYCSGVSTVGTGSGTLLRRKQEHPLPVEIVVSEANVEEVSVSPLMSYMNDQQLGRSTMLGTTNSLGRRGSRSLNGSVCGRSSYETSSMSLPASNKRRSRSASKDVVQVGFYDDNGFIRTAYRSERYNYLGQNCPSPGTTKVTPKVNPSKTRHTMEAIQRGLSVCISALNASLDDSPSKALHLQVKTLEYQQTRLKVIQEEYEVQQKLREGVRSMALAYSSSTGKERDIALANVKAGFKECSEVIAGLDKQVKEFMGGFRLRMKGIQGFARLCPGDTYEITIKHGHQKWKTRGKTGKDGSQTWDVPETEIVALLGEDLFIKAAEVKTLGKQVLLGNKFCDIGELMAAHSQLMTVNLNPSGSLKLNVVVEWNPLAQFYIGRETPVIHRKALLSRSPTPEKEDSSEHSLWEEIHMLECMLKEETEELKGPKSIVKSVKEFLGKASRSKLVKSQSGTSLAVESALECFNFLDTCDVTQTPSPSRKNQKIPKDAEVHSLVSRTPSPSHLHFESLQNALQAHVQICLRLCQKLASGDGPLQQRRLGAMSKLDKQSVILGDILQRLRKGNSDAIDDLHDTPFIQTLWRVVTENESVYCSTSAIVATAVEKYLEVDYEDSSWISRQIVEYITQEPYDENLPVTLFQMKGSLKEYETCFNRLVTEIVEQERMALEVQTPKNVVHVLEQLAQLGRIPGKCILQYLIKYMREDNGMKEPIVLYFQDMPGTLKSQMTDLCLELLEDGDPLKRHDALTLLDILRPEETTDIVNYLADTDPDPNVRNLASLMNEKLI